MFDFHEKRKIRQLIYSKFLIGLLFLLGIFISHSAYERYVIERQMAEKQIGKSEELLELHKRAAALESRISHLENDRGIEEELRSRFDVVKDGEQVVIILEEKGSSDSKSDTITQPLTNEEETKETVWQKFIHAFTF